MSLMSPELAGGFFTTSATWECVMITAGSESVKKMITYTFRLYIPFPYLLLPFFFFSTVCSMEDLFGEKEKETLTLLSCCY